MSSEAQRKSGYPLPPNEWQEETQSFCVTIPAGEAWEMAFRAQLYQLGKWWKWKRDPLRPKAASDAATNWRDILEIVEDCGMEDIRVQGCMLQKLENGEWINVADLTLCGGGGGGFASLGGSTDNIPLTNNVTITSTSFTRINPGAWTRSFTKSKALVQLVLSVSNSGSNDTIVRPHIQQGGTSLNGLNLTQGSSTGTAAKQLVVTDFFSGLVAGNATLEIEWRVTGGTGTVNQNYDVMWTVLEYENLEELFQQDTRYEGGVIQKKIGNVWSDVVDLLALINPIATTANQALSLANNAVNVNNTQQTQINNIIAVNSAQQIVLNNHESRIDSIEDVDLPQINLTLQNHESRIAALEAAAGGGDNKWGGYTLGSVTLFSMNPSGGAFYSNTNSYAVTNPAGWVPADQFGLKFVNVWHVDANRLGAARFVRVTITHLSGADNYQARVNGGGWAKMLSTPFSAQNRFAWLDVPPSVNNDALIEVQNLSGNDQWRMNAVTYLCLVYNPFTLEIFT